MKRANTPKKTEIDWTALDAMTPAQRSAAAIADPDARPLDLKRLKRVPRITTLRKTLKLSQEEFAARYELPVGTVRDWEQGRKEPDSAAKVLLRAIAAGPEIVHELLTKPFGFQTKGKTMNAPTPVMFNLRELAAALIRDRDIHEGKWAVGFEFNTLGLNFGGENEEKPSALIQISKAMLIPYGPHLPKWLEVDAAEVNPPEKKKQA